ncbi:MAG: Lrp/AsnC family transcriptional regulator [Marinomonas sp.]|uniref:Lrp/AsnC family transcriptional regulator n=1 Tax=Marinomonas sp. TaxID=1904862 RepID=UPI0017ABD882|nr:Lrp/AsnC family transcriptional regulator [Oceanospirillaceae bacterium]
MSKWFKDELDRKLVALLQANARESTSTLAKKLDVARSTVHERIARLEKSGVITGYSAVLSHNPSEDNVQAMVMLAVEQKRGKQVVTRLNSFPSVKVCLAINGSFDYFLSVEESTLEELDGLLDDIGDIPGVERSTSWIVLSRKFDRRYKEVLQMVKSQMEETGTP